MANLVIQGLTTVSTVQNHALGDRITDGGNEFIYVKGVSSGAEGAWATYNSTTFATTLLTADAVGPVGIMMAALDATTDYGWLQIFGVNTVASTDTTAAGAALYIDGTAGRADDAAVSGDLIQGAVSITSDTSNVATVFISYPMVINAIAL